ncbi:MAG: hypothetical protein AMS18_12125 [Gemmatimonas sp. SG8_17]|nr:MAG: hypothetical protein AMS18_12125 [Gemmatimonas sp. SG8_17]
MKVMDLRKSAAISVALGVLSAIGLLVSALALTDIAHGEPDLTLEWWIVRVAYLLVVLFQVAALVTLRGILKQPHTGTST